MHDPELVGRGERAQDLQSDVADPLGRHRAAGQLVPERATRQPLHHDERSPVLLAGVEDADDVRVGEAGGQACLGDDALAHAVLLGEIGTEELQGDLTLEAQVLGGEDLPHASVAEPLAQPIAAADDPDLLRGGHPAHLSLRRGPLHIGRVHRGAPGRGGRRRRPPRPMVHRRLSDRTTTP